MNISHLTLDELSQFNNFNACAIYRINPSLSYLISTQYKEIDIFQHGSKIKVKGELHDRIFDHFNTLCNLTKNGNEIIITFENEDKLSQRINHIRWSGGKHILPKQKNNKLIFESQTFDLDFEIAMLKQYITRTFPDNSFTVSYTTTYSFDLAKFFAIDFEIDEKLFWEKMYSEVHGEIFKVSEHHKSISFEFESKDELNMKFSVINAMSEIGVYNRKDKHKFKVYTDQFSERILA